MIELTALWLPILLSAVFVFIVSGVLHMVLQYHYKDYSPTPDEEGLRVALRSQDIGPGMYTFPHCSSAKEMGSEEFTDKMNLGPNGFMTIIPVGPVAMGRNLALWFLFSILIGVFVAYLTAMGVDAGAGFMDVFRVAFYDRSVGLCHPQN